ncbi:ZIP family metal transporter, partial [Georgenia sp.]
MSGVVVAGAWGLVGGSALVLGAAAAWLLQIRPWVVAGIMAFGAGVLISALAFDLMQEAADGGGLVSAIVGFLAGAVAYMLADAVLARHGARHRKRSAGRQ